MRLVFLGPPGAGKGTQARRLSGILGLPHISTGDILRAAIAQDTETGRKVRDYVESGRLVPDDVMEEIVRARLERPDAAQGFILDGFPRTIRQAEALDTILAERGQTLDRAVLFQVDRQVLIERLSGRMVCPVCGTNYHRVFHPPREDEVCDGDGAKLIQRKDDLPETVASRLEGYYHQIQPVVEYYRNRGLLYELDAEGDADTVTRRLLQGLGISVEPV